MKSARSMSSVLEKGTLRVPAEGSSGIIDGLEFLDLAFRVVLDDEADRVEHRHEAGRRLVEVVADGVLKQGDVGEGVVLRDADRLAELADRGGRVAAAAHAGDRRHAGVVPAGDALFLHELEQAALGHHRVGEVEAGELDLLRLSRGVERAEQPVVEGAVHLELQRADRVGDALVRVLERVRVVVHRVDAPLVAGVVVVGLADAVDDRIAHVHVRRGHVDLRAEDRLAFVELAARHLREGREVLLDGCVARSGSACRGASRRRGVRGSAPARGSRRRPCLAGSAGWRRRACARSSSEAW
jgi:hypothetical protein